MFTNKIRYFRLDVLVPVLLVGYFLAFSYEGLFAGFSHDDLMNLWRAHVIPWNELIIDCLVFFKPTEVYRPVGAFFYRTLFAVGGFEPLLFHSACYALLMVNILLSYAFLRRVSGSRETGALGAFLYSYHVHFWPLYFNAGTCYDILAGFFVLSALVYYLRLRQNGQFPGTRQTLALAGLYLLALGSKEVSVVLPVLLLAYECIFNPPGDVQLRTLLHWMRREGAATAWTALMTVAYLVGRIAGPGSIQEVSAYTPNVSLPSYADYFRRTFNDLFYSPDRFTDITAMALLVSLLAVAAIFRSRQQVFGWIMLSTGVLPLAFIRPPRGPYAIYIALVGMALISASLFVQGRDLLWRGVSSIVRFLAKRPGKAASQQEVVYHTFRAATVAILVVLVARAHFNFRERARTEEYMAPQNYEIGAVVNQLSCVDIPAGSRMLFLRDPFFGDEIDDQTHWATGFIVELLHDDVSLDRAIHMDHVPEGAELSTYDYVFTARGLQIIPVDPQTGAELQPLPADCSGN